MGIKFKGSEVAGSTPLATDIAERELAINLVDGKIFSKDSGGNIVTMSGEIAGRAWNTTDTYEVGDLVTHWTAPTKTFISLTVNTNSTPPASGINTDWQELDSVFYNVGLFDILGAAPLEYPDTTGESIGATWYITGLGVDGNGDPVKYTMTTPPLAGTDVVDNDRFIWVAGATGAEQWLWSPFPRIDGERAGVLWNNVRSYLIGDIVIENGIGYLAILDNTNSQPSANPLNWEELDFRNFEGMEYDNSHQYELGDVVSIGDQLYIIGEDPTNAGNPPPPGTMPGDAEWSAEPIGPETGGVFYRAATDYIVGDIISADDGTSVEVYRCIMPYTSATGGAPADFLGEKANWSLVGGGSAASVEVDISGWTSEISGVPGTNPGVPVPAGSSEDLQTIMNIVDDFMDPGTY